MAASFQWYLQADRALEAILERQIVVMWLDIVMGPLQLVSFCILELAPTHAKLSALKNGPSLCYHLGILLLEVESDSLQVVKWFLHDNIWEGIIALGEVLNFRLSHVYREGTSLVDGWAPLGDSNYSASLLTAQSLPTPPDGVSFYTE